MGLVWEVFVRVVGGGHGASRGRLSYTLRVRVGELFSFGCLVVGVREFGRSGSAEATSLRFFRSAVSVLAWGSGTPSIVRGAGARA